MVTSGIAAQILAPGERGRARPARRPQLGFGEDMRDRVGGDGDHADRARVAGAAEPLDHPRRGGAEMAVPPGQRLGQDDLAGLGAARLALRHLQADLTRRSVGSIRSPSRPGRNMPRMRPGLSGRRRMVRPSYRPGPAGRSRASTRWPGARAVCPPGSGAIRMDGGGPGSSQESGRANASPSGSMPVTSTTATSGSDPPGSSRAGPRSIWSRHSLRSAPWTPPASGAKFGACARRTPQHLTAIIGT